ncbi:MAG: bifunctional oligoribonuclease/PAP phosphatase NrnA [Candidatus Magasanikbacteria bacterium]|nr:bifunctional oligoribonuclease/PAP phosphatase NrnA [Candidatus Magasanikbacteria bacterium]
MHRIAKQIHNEILNAKKILLVPHQKPDGDAMGSVSAFSHFLRNIGKPHDAFCLTPITSRLANLPHLIKISTDPNIWNTAEYDVVIVLDSGDLNYAGVEALAKNLPPRTIIINIDHHISNKKFGHHNLVIPTASSTAEVLHFFFRQNNIGISKNMALALLTGLITDTENFSNPGTTEHSLKVASELIRHGANFNLIKNWFLRDKPMEALKLWGVALSRLAKNEKLDIVYTFITLEDLKTHNASETESEGIANFLNNINEGRASLVLKETWDGKIKGSFRTTRDDFDVSLIASTLGGGGHKKASGFLIAGEINEALEKIWAAIEKNNGTV